MRKARIQHITLKIKGQEVKILKPKAKWLVGLEDRCIDLETQTMDEIKITEELFKLIPPIEGKQLTMEDLVEYREQSLDLYLNDTIDDEGNYIEGEPLTITTNKISYKKFVDAIKKIGGIDRIKMAKLFLAICGKEESLVDELTYQEINSVVEALSDMFDDTELQEVKSQLDSFRR